jgi:hypothetical protein
LTNHYLDKDNQGLSETLEELNGHPRPACLDDIQSLVSLADVVLNMLKAAMKHDFKFTLENIAPIRYVLWHTHILNWRCERCFTEDVTAKLEGLHMGRSAIEIIYTLVW